MKALLYLQRLVPAVGLLANGIRYPRLHCGLRVEFEGSGKLTHGDGVSLGEGTRIELPPASGLDIGDNVSISRSVHIVALDGHCLRIGVGTTIQDNCRIYGDVEIGQRCILAPNVFVSSGTHVFDALPHQPIQEQERLKPAPAGPIRIFGDCWFGINAALAPGVTVGRGCVVGANSVVTGDLPPYSVAVGNPARIIRERLAFVPKPRIDAACEMDAPYFYDGFDLNLPSEHAKLAVGSEIILALDRPKARSVRLCVSGQSGDIGFGEQRCPVPRDPGIIEFELGPNSTLPFLKFRTERNCNIHWAELN